MDPGQNNSSGAREETLSAALLAVPGIVTATIAYNCNVTHEGWIYDVDKTADSDTTTAYMYKGKMTTYPLAGPVLSDVKLKA